jgi:hypothetical protein
VLIPVGVLSKCSQLNGQVFSMTEPTFNKLTSMSARRISEIYIRNNNMLHNSGCRLIVMWIGYAVPFY